MHASGQRSDKQQPPANERSAGRPGPQHVRIWKTEGKFQAPHPVVAAAGRDVPRSVHWQMESAHVGCYSTLSIPRVFIQHLRVFVTVLTVSWSTLTASAAIASNSPLAAAAEK